MIVYLGKEHASLHRRLKEVLASETSGINQQIAIELLMASHAMRAGNQHLANTVIDGMTKHARQIVRDYAKFLMSERND